MSAENPGDALAHRTTTLSAENEMAVVPPTNVNVSVCAGAAVGEGFAVADGLGVGLAEGFGVGDGAGRGVAVGLGVGGAVAPGRGVDLGDGVAGTAVASERGVGEGRGTTVDLGLGVGVGRLVPAGVGSTARACGVGVGAAPGGPAVGVGMANRPSPARSKSGASDPDRSDSCASSAMDPSPPAWPASASAGARPRDVTAAGCDAAEPVSAGAAMIASELERTMSKCEAGWITASSTKLTPCHATDTAATLAPSQINTNIAGLTAATMADGSGRKVNRGSNLVRVPPFVDTGRPSGPGA